MTKNRILLSQTFPNHRSSPPFIILSEVESTNNYAMAKLQSGLVKQGTCILAIMQTRGKGQMGKHWLSDPGSNITMSTVVKAMERTYQPFLLSAAVALACVDLLLEQGVLTPKIKWPNDIYINDRKAGGILIENLTRAGQIQYSVIGTGINVNQTSFPLVDQAATSLRVEKATEFDLLKLARKLHHHILARTQALPAEQLMAAYNACLYKKGEEVKLRRQNVLFHTVIREVTGNGELVCVDTIERRFAVGEVNFV